MRLDTTTAVPWGTRVLGDVPWWDMLPPPDMRKAHVDAQDADEAKAMAIFGMTKHDAAMAAERLKQATPTLTELGLASRVHQWREVNRHMRATLRAVMNEVTQTEVEWLAILDMPPIDAVRQAVGETAKVAAGELVIKGPADDAFSRVSPVSPETRRRLAQAFEELEEDLAGPLGVYRQRTLEAYAIGIRHAHTNVELEAQRAGAVQFLVNLPPALVPTVARASVRNFIERGESLIRADVTVRYANEAAEEIMRGFTEGRGVLETAMALHRRVGEGQAWHWNRLVRTETAMAVDLGTDDQFREAQIPYERWQVSRGACPICTALDGRVWRRGEGPRVGWSTHPHCMCVRIPVIRPRREDVIESRFRGRRGP